MTICPAGKRPHTDNPPKPSFEKEGFMRDSNEAGLLRSGGPGNGRTGGSLP